MDHTFDYEDENAPPIMDAEFYRKCYNDLCREHDQLMKKKIQEQAIVIRFLTERLMDGAE